MLRHIICIYIYEYNMIEYVTLIVYRKDKSFPGNSTKPT